MPKYNYYSVEKGENPGVYTDWPQAREQVDVYSNNNYKGFNNIHDAAEFVETGNKSGGCSKGSNNSGRSK